MKPLNDRFVTGKPVTRGFGARPGHWVLFLLNPVIFSFSLTCLYRAMRGVMRLGGFVATGGPYEIAHPAPDWIWIFPVSMLLLMLALFSSLAMASKVHGPNLMSLSWSALFISLGWNFTQFGFGISMGGILVVGWIICAVLFVPMGVIPLVFILRSFFISFRDRGDLEKGQLPWGISILLQLILSGLGILLGTTLFSFLQ